MITETQRLIIRELSIDDAEFVLTLTNQPSTIKNIGDKGLRSLSDAERFILEGPWTFQQKPGYGQFAIELKSNGDIIGVCGILYRSALDLTDVGFALMPQYWRQGFAFEAARAVMEYGSSVLKVENIVGLTSASNTASINLLQKLGLRFDSLISMSADSNDETQVYSARPLTQNE